MASFLDNCRFNPTAGSTTDWTYASAVTGCQSPSAAGAVNGAKYKFLAISADQTQWEMAEGAYTSSTGVFARTTVLYNSSGTTSKISFSAAPQVAVIGILEDLIPSQAHFGLGMANGTIVASVASNVLTVAIKTFDGNDPSPASPVFFFFRDASAATGDYTFRVVTSALSINTNAAGATLGVPNGAPFRFWLHAFDNSGTVALALYQSVTWSGSIPAGITSWNEAAPANTTGISSTATSAATFYTPNGTSLTGKSFAPIGYLDFAGLTTAGSYTASPTTIQLCRHGVKKPGDTGSRAYQTSSTQTSMSSTTFQAGNPSATISLSSASNVVIAETINNVRTENNTNAADVQIFRNGTTAIGQQQGVRSDASASASVNGWWVVPLKAWDAPGTTSSTSYQPFIRSIASGETVVLNNPPGSGDGIGSIELTEIFV